MYQHRKSPAGMALAKAQEWEARCLRAEAEAFHLRNQIDRENRAKEPRLHPGNGDYGHEAFRAEFERAYMDASQLPDPVFYDPGKDPEHPRYELYREDEAA